MKIVKKALWVIPALFLIAAVGAPAVHADVFNITISGADTGNIAITAPSSATGALVTAITGTFDGSTIDSLLPIGSLGGNDNLFYNPADPTYVDYNGISFSLDSVDTAGYAYVNLFFGNPPDYYSYQCDSGLDSCLGATSAPDTLVDPISTPEPHTFTLLLVGIGLLELMVIA
jgi:hypothetical protein